MPTVELTFKLPEERDAFKLATNGDDFYYSIINFDNYLREQIKHHSEELSDDQFAQLEEIRNKLHEIIYEQTNIADISGFVQ